MWLEQSIVGEVGKGRDVTGQEGPYRAGFWLDSYKCGDWWGFNRAGNLWGPGDWMCPSVDSKGIQQRVHARNGFSTLLRLRKWHLHEAEGWTEGKGGYGRLLDLVDTHKDVGAQLCLTICNPVDCSPSGPSLHGIFQARILEWIAVPFSR